MFDGCSNLKYIVCLEEYPGSTPYPIEDFTRNVSSTGVFVKAAGAVWERGNNGIPNGWIVIDA